MRMYLSEVASESTPAAPITDPIAAANQRLEAVKTQREANHATLMKQSDDLIVKAGQEGATLDCASKAL